MVTFLTVSLLRKGVIRPRTNCNPTPHNPVAFIPTRGGRAGDDKDRS